MPKFVRIYRDTLDASSDGYLGRRHIPAAEVAEVRLDRWPPEVMLRDGRIAFASAESRSALTLFARLHGIPFAERADVWALLTEPFLDTEVDENDPATLARLASAGISADEVSAIRRFLRPAMTAATWEWVHYGLADVLAAQPPRLLPSSSTDVRFLPPLWSRDGLRKWAEDLAHRAPVISVRTAPPELSAEEILSRVKGAWPLPDTVPGADASHQVEAVSRRLRALEPIRDQLLVAWSEPHRRYHSVRHLHQVLERVESAAPETRKALALAAWFHDAIYDPTRGDNEERSAEWLERSLQAAGEDQAFSAKTAALAARIVRATATPLQEFPPPTDADDERERDALLRFLDADFSIFASVPEEYDAYARDIREEYRHVDDESFKAGRAAFLRRVLSQVEASGFFFHRAQPIEEDVALQNLNRELAALQAR